MIKANELRIGNVANLNWDGDIRQVTLENVGSEYFSIDGFDESFTYVDLYPIPLTPEILEKIDWNGYVKLNIGSWFKIDDVGHLYYRSDYTGRNVDSLHQLQNLYFALTGEELEIAFQKRNTNGSIAVSWALKNKSS